MTCIKYIPKSAFRIPKFKARGRPASGSERKTTISTVIVGHSWHIRADRFRAWLRGSREENDDHKGYQSRRKAVDTGKKRIMEKINEYYQQLLEKGWIVSLPKKEK